MKVKDLIIRLKEQNPETDVVLKNLYANPLEPSYVLREVRVYKWGDKVIVDGYDKEPFDTRRIM